MTVTAELGRRVELQSMDAHCLEISIGLYRQDSEGETRYVVHSYSSKPEAKERLAFLTRTIATLSGALLREGFLSLPCHASHQSAMRRTFLAACKLPSNTVIEARPLTALDKKTGRTASVSRVSGGDYRITVDGPEAGRQARVESIVTGLRKLGELDSVEGEPGLVRLACGQPHDELMALLLPAALNVRTILREEEAVMTRGLLVAPSAQK